MPNNAKNTEKRNQATTCIECKEPIQSGAKKCNQCDSFQDWRRYFAVGTVVLSLIIALVSVFTNAIVIKSAFPSKRADIRFSFIDYENEKINVVAGNLGNRAGILANAELFVHRVKKDGKEKPPRKIDLKWEKKELLIVPEKPSYFQLTPFQEDLPLPLPRCELSDSTCYYEIKFELETFENRLVVSDLTCPCPK